MIIEKLILGNNHKKFLFIMKQSDFPIDQINVFQKGLSKEYLYNATEGMYNNKFLENDSLTKEFHEIYCDELKEPYIMYIIKVTHLLEHKFSCFRLIKC